MKNKVNKAREIESILSPKIKDVDQEQLEHKPQQISYKLFDRIDLAKEVTEAVDNVIYPQIQEIIEETLDVKLVDFLSDATTENNLSGAFAKRGGRPIAIFEFKPKNV